MKRLPQDNVSVPSATPFAATIGSYVAVPDAPYTVTLPALSSPATDGMEVTVKLNKVDADTVTVNPTGSDTIDGAATFTFANTSGYGCATFKASGTNWGVVSKYKTPPQYNVTVPGATPFAASFGAYIPIPDAPYTINLPALSTPATDGQSIVLKLNKNDPDLITVTPNGSDTIDGAASFTFSNTDGYGSVTLIASGTNWGVN